jgi:hypothetical protein
MTNARDDVPVLAKILALLKQKVDGMPQQKIHETIEEHYQTLGLMDERGQWASQNLALISNQLLPDSVSLSDVLAFIDAIGKNLKKNDYLVPFFKSLENAHFVVLSERFREEGDKVIPDVVCYAMMLENLSTACADDYRIFQECFHLLSDSRGRREYFRQLTFFTKVKLLSVEKPVRTRFACNEKRRVPPTSGRLAVSINILEATITDWTREMPVTPERAWYLQEITAVLRRLIPKRGLGQRFSRGTERLSKGPIPSPWNGHLCIRPGTCASAHGSNNFPTSSANCSFPLFLGILTSRENTFTIGRSLYISR